MDFDVVWEFDSRARRGRRKKNSEVMTTEKPAKLVMRIEINEAKIKGDEKLETRNEKIRMIYARKPRVPVVAR